MRVQDLQTPTLVVDLDVVAHNLATMRHYLGDRLERWRPHVKTTKIPEVLSMLLDAGVRRFKVATTREAEQLLRCASRRQIDLLFAMSMHGANLQRVTDIVGDHPRQRFSMLSENPQHSQVLREAGLRVMVDLDPGYHRTGIPLMDRERIDATILAAGSSFAGLHCYDGHLHDPDAVQRADAARAVYAELVAIARTLPEPGEICTSGTPTFSIALDYDPLRAFDHTVGPGTVVYWDARSQQLGIEGFACAVQVQSQVISAPLPGRITVNAGSKALDAAAGDPCAEALGGYRLRALTPSEEHLPMVIESGDAPAVGSLLRLLPRHVCPTVNLASEAALVQGGELIRVVPVAARGHALLPSST
jgi:D-serine deaminase-like pyridoxal phosphate-dependent protein